MLRILLPLLYLQCLYNVKRAQQCFLIQLNIKNDAATQNKYIVTRLDSTHKSNIGNHRFSSTQDHVLPKEKKPQKISITLYNSPLHSIIILKICVPCINTLFSHPRFITCPLIEYLASQEKASRYPLIEKSCA